MFCLIIFVSVLFLMHIAPITYTINTKYQFRPIRIPRIPYEPCRNQEIGKFIKDRYYCDKFFYCGPNELAISVDCPHGMIFNDKKEICDFSSNYLCIPEIREEDDLNTTIGETETSAVSPIDSVTTDDQCPINDAGNLVFLPNKNECHRYYICYHGRPVPHECIRELHWNPKKKSCDFPKNAGCLASTLTTVPSTSAATVNCPFRGEQIFPHPEQCNYFIYCINGYATVQQCPFFHHYDVQSKSCMWQTVAKCIISKSAIKPVRIR